MDDRLRHPEPVDYAQAGPQLLAALERRRSRRLSGGPPWVIPALVIARRFSLRPHGSRDSQRRGARLLVERLREEGHQILAVPGSDGGYFLPSVAADLVSYSDDRRAGGLAHLVAASKVKHSPDLADAQGQLGLFSSRRQPAAGVASTVLH